MTKSEWRMMNGPKLKFRPRFVMRRWGVSITRHPCQCNWQLVPGYGTLPVSLISCGCRASFAMLTRSLCSVLVCGSVHFTSQPVVP